MTAHNVQCSGAASHGGRWYKQCRTQSPHRANRAKSYAAGAQERVRILATQQRWAEIEIAASGDAAQEAVGAVVGEIIGAGYAASAVALTTYVPVDERLENTLLALKDALHTVKRVHKVPGTSDEITVRFVAEDDWANAWKQYFKPQKIGQRIVVKPTWEEYVASPDEIVIEIDPGMAFGTGLHATTRLCLAGLEHHVTLGATVADVGTGSGILAVAAILLGAESAEAVDNDPLAVDRKSVV